MTTHRGALIDCGVIKCDKRNMTGIEVPDKSGVGCLKADEEFRPFRFDELPNHVDEPFGRVGHAELGMSDLQVERIDKPNNPRVANPPVFLDILQS